MSDDELLDLIRTRDADEPELSDDKLRPMRAIWLELPDEDAPVRGLDALMAAATMKAREMAPPAPSFWQRFVALLKQPPVLAMATIVVLVGGATLVNRHEDEIDAVPVAVRSPSPADKFAEPAVAAVPTVPAGIPTTQLAGSAASGGEATTAGLLREKEKAGSPKLPDKLKVTKPTVSVPPPPPPVPDALELRASGRVGGAGSGSVSVDRDFEAQKPEAPSDPATMTKGTINQNSGDDSRAETVVREGTAPPQRPQPDRSQALPQPSTVDQLLKDCKTAASRGDCPAVRVLADRIARTNATFYRERVTKDAAIAKCLN